MSASKQKSTHVFVTVEMTRQAVSRFLGFDREQMIRIVIYAEK